MELLQICVHTSKPGRPFLLIFMFIPENISRPLVNYKVLILRLSTKISSASIEDNKYKNKMSILGEYGCYRMLLPLLLLLLTDPVAAVIKIQTYTAIRPGNSITGRTTTQIPPRQSLYPAPECE